MGSPTTAACAPHITHHGAVTGVTGSCHQLDLPTGEAVLIDCGLFQGDERSGHERSGHERPGQNPQDLTIDFPLDPVRALLVTHCHIDHVGRIPFLLAAGFDGPIYATEATARLLPLVIEDAIQVGIARDPTLTRTVLNRLRQLLQPIPYDRWFDVAGMPHIRARFRVAGHILGSAYIEFDVAGCRVTLSGDLGAPWSPLLPAPRPPYRADLLVIESTYGDRLHEGRRTRRERLRRVIERALRDAGTVLIPAFSIGRTQELLYEIEEIIHREQGDWARIDVIVDSPLAARFTEHYRALKPLWDAEARHKVGQGRHPLSFDQLITIDDHAQHMRLVRHLQQSGRPAIVIAASGMCAGGRMQNYLEALLPDPRTDVVFVGYQARGTPGRVIQQSGPDGGTVILNGKRVEIRAGVHTLSGYSAHADQQDLVRFVRGIRRKPAEIRVVHGDPEAKAALAAQLSAVAPQAKVWIPEG